MAYGVLLFFGAQCSFLSSIGAMVDLLNQLQRSLGVTGFAAALAGSGFAIGLFVGLLVRRSSPGSASPPSSGVAKTDPIQEATSSSSGDKRRNPRRPGRSVEVFVGMPGSMGEPCKGVVLDRSVGGLGLLVGDEYPIGSKLSVLPATASKLTPWVDVEVKSCRKSGDDWEIGVQFISIPPYATMVLFG